MKYQNLMAILVLAAGFAFSAAVVDAAGEEGQSRSRTCWGSCKSCCRKTVSTAVDYAEGWSDSVTEMSSKYIEKLADKDQRHKTCKNYLKHLGYTAKDGIYMFIVGKAAAQDYANKETVKRYLLELAQRMATKETHAHFSVKDKDKDKLKGDIVATLAAVMWTLFESAIIITGNDRADRFISAIREWIVTIKEETKNFTGLQKQALNVLGFSLGLITSFVEVLRAELVDQTAAASDGGGVVPVVVPVGSSAAADTVATV